MNHQHVLMCLEYAHTGSAAYDALLVWTKGCSEAAVWYATKSHTVSRSISNRTRDPIWKMPWSSSRHFSVRTAWTCARKRVKYTSMSAPNSKFMSCKTKGRSVSAERSLSRQEQMEPIGNVQEQNTLTSAKNLSFSRNAARFWGQALECVCCSYLHLFNISS